jgi:type II secretory pathway component PulM
MTDEIRDLKNALGRLSADLCVLTIQVSENLAMTDLRTEAMQAEIDMLRLDCAEIKQELRDLAASAAQAQAAAEGIASATALLRSLHRAGLDAAEQARS